MYSAKPPSREMPMMRSSVHTWRWPKRPELADWLIVHGHTPNDELSIEVKPQRINIDTGAVYGGALTCVVLAEGEEPRFIQT